MSPRDIQHLRNKFIFTAMISLFLAMVFIGGASNIVTFAFTRRAIHRTLDDILMSQMQGESESSAETEQEPLFSDPSLSDIFSPLFRRNRYVVLFYDETGALEDLHNGAWNEAEAWAMVDFADEALQSRRNFGRFGVFYFQKAYLENERVVLAFLDCSSEITVTFQLLYATVGICAFGLLVTFWFVRRFSDRAIQPEIENGIRQRQFITNASHELKTPLAVIRANTELEELMHGKSEWTTSTLQQVDRLSGLVQNLVMIAKAQEQEDKDDRAQINVSQTVEQSVNTYDALARQSGKTLLKEIPPELTLVADESKLRQLVTLLVDNAIKYCDPGGTITVALQSIRKGRGIQLTVSNSYAEGASVDYNRFFDRFYRADTSHNIDQGGYGIGLSIAESICRRYGGCIRAQWKDGVISFICQLN